jgi:hypothetical protein
VPVVVAAPGIQSERRLRMSSISPEGPSTWGVTAQMLDRDIMLARDALPFVAKLTSFAEALGLWKPATVIGDGDEYVDMKHRTSRRLSISSEGADPNGPLWSWAAQIAGVEGALVTMYQQIANPHMAVQQGTGWDLLRYGVGDFFGEHVDQVRGNPGLAQRRLSVVTFCNSDFDGGELFFPRQGITIVPEAGAVVLFPSGCTHPHEAFPVKRGVKYSLVTWFL